MATQEEAKKKEPNLALVAIGILGGCVVVGGLLSLLPQDKLQPTPGATQQTSAAAVVAQTHTPAAPTLAGTWNCQSIVHNFKNDKVMKTRSVITIQSNGTWQDNISQRGSLNEAEASVYWESKQGRREGSLVTVEAHTLEFVIALDSSTNLMVYCTR